MKFEVPMEVTVMVTTICFRPGCSEQNTQWIWSVPLTKVGMVGYVSVITGP